MIPTCGPTTRRRPCAERRLLSCLLRATGLGGGLRPVYRKWYIEQPQELPRFVQMLEESEHLVSVDTEMEPPICSLVSEEEVHVFTWDERAAAALRPMFASPRILKTASLHIRTWRPDLRGKRLTSQRRLSSPRRVPRKLLPRRPRRPFHHGSARSSPLSVFAAWRRRVLYSPDAIVSRR